MLTVKKTNFGGSMMSVMPQEKEYPMFPKANATHTPVQRELHDRWVKAGIIPDTSLPAMAKQGE